MTASIAFRSWLIGALLLMATPGLAAEQDAADLPAFFANWLQTELAQRRIPNAAIAVVAGDEIVFIQGYGQAQQDDNSPVDPSSSLFRIGSTAKVFTWLAVMQLVEQGRLELDADINSYLDFTIPDRLAIGPQRDAAPITLAHLMTHTPGFEDYPDAIFRLAAEQMPPLAEYVRTRLPARVFPPGTVAAYSNYGTALAGYIVERVAAVPFEQYVAEHIFAPLGMTQSSFHQPLPAALAPQLVQAYRHVDGEFRPGRFEYMPAPAGAMSTSAEDMAAFMRAYLKGSSILTEATRQRMHGRQFGHHPLLGGMAHGLMQNSVNDRPVLFHGGATMLFDAAMYLLPEQQLGLFIAYSGGDYRLHAQLFQDFMNRFYPAAAPRSAPARPDGAAERAARYIGEYHQNRKSFTTSQSLLSLAMGLIQVGVDEHGDLLVQHLGGHHRFIESEPGVYRNADPAGALDYFGSFGTLVFGQDPLGRTLLMADGPLSYSRAPWYATSGFTALTVLTVTVFVLLSLLGWGIGLSIAGVRGRRTGWSPPIYLAHGTAVLFGLVLLLALLLLIATGNPDPVYRLPQAAYAPRDWFVWIDRLLLALLPLGLALPGWTAWLWYRGGCSRLGRLHYTLFTGLALVLLWLLWYWNIW